MTRSKLVIDTFHLCNLCRSNYREMVPWPPLREGGREGDDGDGDGDGDDDGDNDDGHVNGAGL